MTPPDILGGLTGLRLALADELLAAGPRGCSAPDLLWITALDAERRGEGEAEQRAALRWLLEQGIAHEYTPGKYRARPREQWGTGNAEPETRNVKPEASAVAQLRTPIFAPRLRRDGQGTFF